jgi:hypothetical protein
MSTAEQSEFVSVEDDLAAEELAETKSECIGGWFAPTANGPT